MSEPTETLDPPDDVPAYLNTDTEVETLPEPTLSDQYLIYAIVAGHTGYDHFDPVTQERAARRVRAHVLAECSVLMRALSEARIEILELRRQRDAGIQRKDA